MGYSISFDFAVKYDLRKRKREAIETGVTCASSAFLGLLTKSTEVWMGQTSERQ